MRRLHASVSGVADMDLIVSRPEGLYCPPGDFYIDPWRPVARAIVTHGHADHARSGNASYLCQEDSVPILRKRLGDINVQGLRYPEDNAMVDLAAVGCDVDVVLAA